MTAQADEKGWQVIIQEAEYQAGVIKEVDQLSAEWQGLGTAEKQNERLELLLGRMAILTSSQRDLCANKLAQEGIIPKREALKEIKKYARGLGIKDDEAQKGAGEGRTQASKLVSLAQKNTNLFFHDTTQTPFVRIQVGSHLEIWPCRSSNFKRWLAHKFWETEDTAPNPEALTSALNVLEGYAGFDGTAYKLYNRGGKRRRSLLV